MAAGDRLTIGSATKFGLGKCEIPSQTYWHKRLFRTNFFRERQQFVGLASTECRRVRVKNGLLVNDRLDLFDQFGTIATKILNFDRLLRPLGDFPAADQLVDQCCVVHLLIGGKSSGMN